jgi:hypothetical protein
MSRVHKPAIMRSDTRRLGARFRLRFRIEDLMPSQHGFGDDSTKATRLCKPDDSDDQMKEKPGCRSIVSKSQKAAEFRPIL